MAINAVGRTTIQGATTVGGFNPATLFSAGEQGVWYDPSDLSTLFQDSAGTIPVTALEQPVGRMLDKSGRGNTATQATSANRPVVSARVNLLTYSNVLNNAVWTYGNMSAPTQNALGYDGSGLTAWTATAKSGASTRSFGYQTLTASSVTNTFSLYAKKGTWNYIYLNIQSASANNWITAVFDLNSGTMTQSAVGVSSGTITATSITDAGGGFYRIVLTGTVTSAAIPLWGFANAATGNSLDTYGQVVVAAWAGTETFIVQNADLRPTNQGVGLPVYQRVGAAVAGTSTTVGNADYNANGFPVYLAFDGSDDSLATGNINFSATDKATAWTGVRKTKTAGNFGMLVELSSSIVNNNSFNITAPGSAVAPATENYTFFTCGAANFTGYDAVTFTPPITSVLSCAYDNAGATRADQVKPRVNGVIPTLNAGGAGNTSSGNYSNSPLYIGARAGTSLFFAGNLYGLIVRGASSTANQITGAENWLNQKTAAY